MPDLPIIEAGKAHQELVDAVLGCVFNLAQCANTWLLLANAVRETAVLKSVSLSKQI
jgi:hypothetical protein